MSPRDPHSEPPEAFAWVHGLPPAAPDDRWRAQPEPPERVRWYHALTIDALVTPLLFFVLVGLIAGMLYFAFKSHAGDTGGSNSAPAVAAVAARTTTTTVPKHKAKPKTKRKAVVTTSTTRATTTTTSTTFTAVVNAPRVVRSSRPRTVVRPAAVNPAPSAVTTPATTPKATTPATTKVSFPHTTAPDGGGSPLP